MRSAVQPSARVVGRSLAVSVSGVAAGPRQEVEVEGPESDGTDEMFLLCSIMPAYGRFSYIARL